MPVKKDASGRRSVQAEAEVPGTPEEVWQAIATGPGISAWFVPTEMEHGPDGAPKKVLMHFGPGGSMDSASHVTAWDPPHRLVAENHHDMGPKGPTMATEWTVEARAGGTCLVRVVHSWFATTDEWDDQFEGMEHGWPAFFRILRLYLLHFRGQRSSLLQLMPFAAEPMSSAWSALVGPLGLTGAAPGQHVRSAAGAPRLAGHVERIGPPDHPELLLRLDEPGAGVGHLFAVPMGGSICLAVRLFFYGEQAPAVVAHEEPLWQAWLGEHLPQPAANAS